MEKIDYLSKIGMKDAKTGILIQAEFRFTMEFINIINGLCNACFVCFISIWHPTVAMKQVLLDTCQAYGCFWGGENALSRYIYKILSLWSFWFSLRTVFKIHMAFNHLDFYLHIYSVCNLMGRASIFILMWIPIK